MVSAMKRLVAIACLMLSGSPIAALGADDPEASPEPSDFEALVPAESTREDVIRILGEPEWVHNLYTIGDAVRVRLPKTPNDTISQRIPRDKRVWLRVLRYPGDERYPGDRERREFYAAVLHDDIYQYGIGPVAPDERELGAVMERFGAPELVLHAPFVLIDQETRRKTVPRGSIEAAWYPRRGLAYLRDAHGERINAKLHVAPRETVPLLDPDALEEPRDRSLGKYRGKHKDVFDDICLEEPCANDPDSVEGSGAASE